MLIAGLLRWVKLGITIIDDYGHHPVEISAVLRAARQISLGRVIAVHQPHRYTRLNALFKDFCSCFNDADIVAIADVYSAGEKTIPGASRDDLVTGLVSHGHRHAVAVSNLQDLSQLIAKNAKSGDIVICLGAGTISSWANSLQKYYIPSVNMLVKFPKLVVNLITIRCFLN